MSSILVSLSVMIQHRQGKNGCSRIYGRKECAVRYLLHWNKFKNIVRRKFQTRYVKSPLARMTVLRCSENINLQGKVDSTMERGKA